MTTTTIFSVPEVTCEQCKSALEGALNPATGVDKVEVDIPAKSVTVSYDADRIGVAALTEIMEEQGYDVDKFEEAS